MAYLTSCLIPGANALCADELDLIEIASTLCFPLVHVATPYKSLKFLYDRAGIDHLLNALSALSDKYITNDFYKQQIKKVEEEYFFRACGNFAAFVGVSLAFTLIIFIITG